MPQHSIPNRTLNEVMTLIEQRTGLAASTRLRLDLDRMLDQLAGGDVPALLSILRMTDTASPEWQALIAVLTIGETYFLRDKRHFDLLKTQIFPQVTLEKRKDRNLKLRIWCAGCSTGEEPYSIAITLQEFLPDISSWNVQLVGTDINHQSIEAANRGIYRDWSFRHTTDYFRRRYFDKLHETSWQIKPHIQSMVTFEQGNALGRTPMEDVDIVFCRNMLLYIGDRSTQIAEDTFYRLLRRGGWLFLGHAETLRYRRNRWRLHPFPGTPVYQKPAGHDEQTQAKGRRRVIKRTLVEMAKPVPSAATEAQYEKAVKALHQEQFTEAETIITDLLQDQKEHAKSQVLLGALLAGRHEFDEAATHLQTALTLEPLLADAHYIKALICGEQDETEDRIKALKAALYCDRNHLLAMYLLTEVYRQQGNFSEVERLTRRSREILEDHEPTAYLSDVSEMRAGQLMTLLGISETETTGQS